MRGLLLLLLLLLLLILTHHQASKHLHNHLWIETREELLHYAAQTLTKHAAQALTEPAP